MLDHLSLQCSDLEASALFYNAVLPTLGAHLLVDLEDALGYGTDRPTFWIGAHRTGEGFRETHVAFTAEDRDAVRSFFDAAVNNGAEILHEPQVWPDYHHLAAACQRRLLHEPQVWPDYHPDYFAAFVRDPDGNNIEAVSHRPE